VIDTEEKAYWLGMMAADGNVATGRPVLKLAFASKDRDHLLSFGSALQSTHSISDYTNNGHKVAELVVSSPQLTKGLAQHGVGPRKTFVLKWPDFLSAELLRHYLRGFFDGDGTLSANPRSRIRKRDGVRPITLGWSILGNEAFCLEAQRYLVEKTGVGKTKLNTPKHSPSIRYLIYGGTRQVSRIFHFMYDDATVWLHRKGEKVAPYIQ